MRLPIRLHPICDFLGIDIRYTTTSTESFDAFYIQANNAGRRRLIIINDAFPLPHQRFSAAHELGHMLLEHGQAGLLGDQLPPEKIDLQERDANRFAAELLMPMKLLLQHRCDRAEQIRYLCDVSLETAHIRLAELQMLRSARPKAKRAAVPLKTPTI